MRHLLFAVPVGLLVSLATLGCSSGDSQPGGKSEMERMAEQMERESAGKPVAANATPADVQRNGEKNYEKYLLEKYREGVTPENNAAVLFWQAIWPGEFLEPADYEPIAKELGLKSVPSSEGTLKSVFSKTNQQRIRDWLRTNGKPNATNDDEYDFTDRAMRTPWTSESAPPLADWVKENQKPLDMLVEASKRPRFYSPPFSLLNDKDESILELLSPGPQSARAAGRSLAVRAMWNLGEGRPNDAWRDLVAIYRLGRLVNQGPTFVEQLVGFALDGIAKDATLAILGSGKPTSAQANQIHSELVALSEYSSMADAFDVGERASIEDATARIRHGKRGDWLALLKMDDSLIAFMQKPADWNIVNQRIDDMCDRISEAAHMPPGKSRSQAFDAINRDISKIEADATSKMRSTASMSEGERAELYASILLALQLPSVDIALNAQDRTNTNLTLTRLAAALAVHRAEHGSYPDSLDALVPGIIDKLPVDCYHENAFVYKPTQNGYTLYSRGPNGEDDDGENAKMEPRGANTPESADDVAIRMPPLP